MFDYQEMLAAMREMDIEPNWFIICAKNEGDEYIVYHQVVYANEPQQEDINSLYSELATDEEFGLQDIVDDLTFYVVSREEFERFNLHVTTPM